MSKTPESPRNVRAISDDRLIPTRSDSTDWNFSVPAGTLPEDLLQPDYWKHVAAGGKTVKARDRIHAECEDRSWMASYTVRDVGPLHIRLALLAPDSDGVCWFNQVTNLPLESATHYVEWGGIGQLHVVRRKSDKDIIEKRFKTPEAAAAWMHKHCADIAA